MSAKRKPPRRRHRETGPPPVPPPDMPYTPHPLDRQWAQAVIANLAASPENKVTLEDGNVLVGIDPVLKLVRVSGTRHNLTFLKGIFALIGYSVVLSEENVRAVPISGRIRRLWLVCEKLEAHLGIPVQIVSGGTLNGDQDWWRILVPWCGREAYFFPYRNKWHHVWADEVTETGFDRFNISTEPIQDDHEGNAQIILGMLEALKDG